MKSIQKESKIKKKIPIQCKLCEYNFQNEYCQINDREDEFADFPECDAFIFCIYHLIDYLTEREKE